MALEYALTWELAYLITLHPEKSRLMLFIGVDEDGGDHAIEIPEVIVTAAITALNTHQDVIPTRDSLLYNLSPRWGRSGERPSAEQVIQLEATGKPFRLKDNPVFQAFHGCPNQHRHYQFRSLERMTFGDNPDDEKDVLMMRVVIEGVDYGFAMLGDTWRSFWEMIVRNDVLRIASNGKYLHLRNALN